LSLAVAVPSDTAVRRLALARLVSVAGSVSAAIALAAVLYARTGSAVWVAAALFIMFATPALVSPLAGALGDRVDRRQLLIWSDLLGAACFVGMAFVSAPAALLAISFPAALAESPFLPGSGAMVPAVAGAERLTWANSRLAVAREAGGIVGPLLGGGIVAIASGSAAFAFNAGSFVVSAALIATLTGDFRAKPDPADAGRGSRISEGVRLILREPTLRALTLGFILVDFGNGLVLPAEVALSHVFGAGSAGYGLLVGLWGAGGVAGAHVAARIVDRYGEPPAMVGSAAVLALAFGLTAVAPWFALALGALAIGGASMSVTGVAEEVLLQRRVADSVRSRVYAAHMAAINLSLAIPLLFAGFMVNAIGAQAVYGVAAGLAGLGVLALTTLLRRRAAATAA
jgi:MFS family permease